MADSLLQEITSMGQDSPTSALSFVANDSPEDEELAKQVMRDTSGAMGPVNKWRQGAKQDTKYYNGNQWADLDRMRMEQLRRPALTFNEISDKINAVSGIERLNRPEPRFVTRAIDSDIMHDAAGDLATESVATVEDNTNGEMEDSQAILDAIVSGMGWVEISMDYRTDLDGQIMKRRIDNMEMLWDSKATGANLFDAKWRARVKNFTRKEFKKRWPDKVDKIDDAAVYYQEDKVDKYELVDPFYSLANERANPAIDIQPTASISNVPVIQYQWIDQVPVYRMADPQNPEGLKTLTEEQWDALKTKNQLSGQPMPNAVRQLKGVFKQVYVAMGVVLEDPVVLPGWTFICITGQYDSDKKCFYGMVRSLRDPQDTINKAISSLVTQYITNAKGGLIFKTGTFADENLAKTQWAGADSWIQATRESDLQKDIVQRQPIQMPQTPTVLFQESQALMTRISGVSDEMSGTAIGEQTGPNIDKRQQGSLLVLGWLWDNVSRYKKSVARVELEFVREYWSNGQLIRVGGDFNSKSVPLLKESLPGPLDYELVLDQSVRYNPNLKAQLWRDLMEIAGPLLKRPEGGIILTKGLKYSNFPTQFIVEVQQALAEAPPPPPKGGGKQEDPNFTQAKIEKMGAETQRTLAETRKLDIETHTHIGEFAVDALHKGHDMRMRGQEQQQKILAARVKHARGIGGLSSI